MAINRPITKTIISTTAWGIPITDEVNRIASLTDSRTPTVWTNLTLGNGWTSTGSNGVPGYRKIGDMVYLRGMISGGANSTTCATLPTGFRPPSLTDLICYQWPSAPGACLASIAASGAITIVSITGTPPPLYVSLANAFFSITP